MKDHLGNIREVLTEQSDLTVYSATLESAVADVETALFGKKTDTRVAKPAGYPNDPTTNPNDYVAKLNGNDKKIGPSVVLCAMAGDIENDHW